jgi:hypothetical protein
MKKTAKENFQNWADDTLSRAGRKVCEEIIKENALTSFKHLKRFLGKEKFVDWVNMFFRCYGYKPKAVSCGVCEHFKQGENICKLSKDLWQDCRSYKSKFTGKWYCEATNGTIWSNASRNLCSKCQQDCVFPRDEAGYTSKCSKFKVKTPQMVMNEYADYWDCNLCEPEKPAKDTEKQEKNGEESDLLSEAFTDVFCKQCLYFDEVLGTGKECIECEVWEKFVDLHEGFDGKGKHFPMYAAKAEPITAKNQDKKPETPEFKCLSCESFLSTCTTRNGICAGNLLFAKGNEKSKTPFFFKGQQLNCVDCNEYDTCIKSGNACVFKPYFYEGHGTHFETMCKDCTFYKYCPKNWKTCGDSGGNWTPNVLEWCVKKAFNLKADPKPEKKKYTICEPFKIDNDFWERHKERQKQRKTRVGCHLCKWTCAPTKEEVKTGQCEGFEEGAKKDPITLADVKDKNEKANSEPAKEQKHSAVFLMTKHGIITLFCKDCIFYKYCPKNWKTCDAEDRIFKLRNPKERLYLTEKLFPMVFEMLKKKIANIKVKRVKRAEKCVSTPPSKLQELFRKTTHPIFQHAHYDRSK